MRLTELRLQNFRCLESVQLEPGPGLNFVVGDNGSGKSSLLEAIYFLSRADSFRHGSRTRLIRDGAAELAVFGRLSDEGGTPFTAGVAYATETARIKLGPSEGATVLELVRALPVQLLDPRLQQLLEEGPAWRRRFLDWGVFHVEHGFYEAWRRYRRALLQRNRALRAGLTDAAVNAWNPELVAAGGEVDAHRRQHAAALREALPALLPPELGAVELQYHAGWAHDQGLADSLARHLASDRQAGHTASGPHRADLRVRFEGLPVAQRASRGEQKLLTVALFLAQAQVVQAAGKRPVLLIDDLAAELGADYRAWVLRQLAALDLQAFLSFLTAAEIGAAAQSGRMFHVEQGRMARTP